MAKTVIGVFDSLDRMRRVVSDLKKDRFDEQNISVIAPQSMGSMTGTFPLSLPDAGTVNAGGPLMSLMNRRDEDRAGGRISGLADGLMRLGIPRGDAGSYASAVRSGRTMVCVLVEDERADEAANIMSRLGSLPIGEREAASPPPSPATGATGRAAPAASTQPAQPARTARTGKAGEEIHEEVIQEEVRIGKREVDRGGVRVVTHTSEQPVTEDVTLREEHAKIERHKVDRPATQEELRRADEEVVVRETAEEPVISKEARVVEDVVISKEATEHSETIKETARRRDVDVEQIPGRSAGSGMGATTGAMPAGSDFARFEQDFRGHSQSAFAGRGAGYEQVSPAYRYGWQLAQDQRNRGRDWMAVRGDARNAWEQQNPGTWDKIEAAVRYAYDRTSAR